MKGNRMIPWRWRRYLAAIMIVALASAFWRGCFADLGRGIPYLTYYPAVMLAAMYGGLHAGILATAISSLLCYSWVQRGVMSSVEWLAMGVFFLSCSMVSGLAEMMRRAQSRAKREKERAEAANRAKSVFIAHMSHELRTPLNAILGFAKLMLHDETLGDGHQRTLAIITRSGEHLLGLINDMRDIAKIEAGKTVLAETAFGLRTMVQEIVELIRRQAEAKGLTLTLCIAQGVPHCITADAGKLRQVRW